MTELRTLTGARGVAAWLVVLYHVRLSIAGLPAPVERILAKGYLAVDFFFLLSGFVIWSTWHDRLRDGGAAAIPLFLQKRIARIWPLHAVMLAAAAALALLLAASGRADPAFPPGELPLHLLLVQNWGLTDTLRWNDPAWSISCELAAYLLFPVLAVAVDWRTLKIATLLAIAAALLLALHWIMRGEPTLGADIPRFGLVRCVTEFAVGTIVAALWLRAGRIRVPLAIAAVLLGFRMAGAPETLVVPAAFAALLLALATSSCRTRSGIHDAALPASGWTPEQARSDGGKLERALHHLGEISYATYLSHFLLWKAFKLAFVHSPTISPAAVALYLAIVLAASEALHRYVERPAQRRINALRPVPRRVPPPVRR